MSLKRSILSFAVIMSVLACYGAAIDYAWFYDNNRNVASVDLYNAGVRCVARTAKGGVNVTVTEPTTVEVYDTAGILVCSISAERGNNFIELPAGMWLVRTGNMTTKTVVK